MFCHTFWQNLSTLKLNTFAVSSVLFWDFKLKLTIIFISKLIEKSVLSHILIWLWNQNMFAGATSLLWQFCFKPSSRWGNCLLWTQQWLCSGALYSCIIFSNIFCIIFLVYILHYILVHCTAGCYEYSDIQIFLYMNIRLCHIRIICPYKYIQIYICIVFLIKNYSKQELLSEPKKNITCELTQIVHTQIDIRIKNNFPFCVNYVPINVKSQKN